MNVGIILCTGNYPSIRFFGRIEDTIICFRDCLTFRAANLSKPWLVYQNLCLIRNEKNSYITLFLLFQVRQFFSRNIWLKFKWWFVKHTYQIKWKREAQLNPSVHNAEYRHSSISAVSISAIFDLLWFIILSYFPPL